MPKLALAFDILANSSQAERTLDRFGNKAERTSKRVGHTFGGLGKTLVGAVAGFATISVFKGFIADAEQSRRVGRLTAQVIKTTGHAAHISAKQVGELTTAISNKTGIDDEAIQSGANLLLTFTGIRNEVGKGNDIFNQATSIITDMSAALGQDMSASAIQLGKALNDPIRGVTALQRVGVSFTEQQKKQIKTLVDSGRTLDAQKVILRELGKEFGGAAAAAATPTAKLKVAINNLSEDIGGLLLPAVDKVATFLNTKGVPAIDKFVHGFQDGTGPGGKFADAVHQVGDGLDHAWHVGKPFLEFIGKHPKLFTDVAIGAGSLAAAFKIMGSVKKLPGLGSLVSKATPLPVFVTNPGFGVGGPGSPKGGPKIPPVVTRTLPKVSPLIKTVGIGSVLLTKGDSAPLSGAQKSNRDFIVALNRLAGAKGQYDKARIDLLKRAAGINFDTSDSKNSGRVGVRNLVAEYDFLVKYGKQTSEVRAKIAALAKDPTVATALKQRAQDVANNTRLISGDLLGLMDAASKHAKKTGDDVYTGLGGGLGRAKERADALQDSLNKVHTPRVDPSGFVGLGGGMARAKENADNLRASINGLPSAFKPPVDAAHSFLTQLNKIPTHKDIIFTASIKTSGKRIQIAGLQTDSAGVYVQGFGGKKLLADGGWVFGPGTSRSDSIPAMLSNREFVVNAKAAQRYAPQLEAMNTGRDVPTSGGGYNHYGDLIVNNNGDRPLSAREIVYAQRTAVFLAGQR